jgi:hypothetical protein
MAAMLKALASPFQPVERFASDVQVSRFPGRESAFHFHHRIASVGELDAGLRRKVAGLRVAVLTNPIGRVSLEWTVARLVGLGVS